MDFETFLAIQTEIYEKFERLAAEAETKGIQRDHFIADQPNQKTGFLIALAHPPQIVDLVSAFTERIQASRVPMIPYLGDAVHNTFSNYAVRIINPDEENTPDQKISDKLCQVVDSCGRNWKVEIDYSHWLHNLTTVVAKGCPNKAFLAYAKKVKEEAAKSDIELGLPWGAHITAARFLKGMEPEQLKDFFKLMKEAPGLDVVSKPTHLGVGYFTINDQKIDYEIIEKFALLN